jgi:HK97 family phage portal protein
MSFLSRVFGRGEAKGMTSLQLFREVMGGKKSKSGSVVTWSNALEVTTVLACTRVNANGISQVPFRLYKSNGESREVASDHSLSKLISRRPNGWQTSYTFRETLMFHLMLTGNAFVWKGMVGSDRRIVALEPIEPGRVNVKRSTTGVLTYEVRSDNGQVVTFDAGEIWHIRGPSWDTYNGLDATKLARDAIGLSMATENAHADFHKNSARVSGLLSVKNKLGPEKFEFLSAWLGKHSEGGENAGKPVILDDEAKFTSMQMTGVDAQHLETRKHQIEEICRGAGVMPIMVGHADKTATYASAEQMFLAHVVHTLSPWYARIEQSADMNLLSEAELDAGYYTKFMPNALMRGAASDRAAFYIAALGTTQQPGWMVRNEIRALEDLNPVDGGDVFPELITNAGPDVDTAEEDDNGTD